MDPGPEYAWQVQNYHSVIKHLDNHGDVTVIGPPGSGKTVFAGRVVFARVFKGDVLVITNNEMDWSATKPITKGRVIVTAPEMAPQLRGRCFGTVINDTDSPAALPPPFGAPVLTLLRGAGANVSVDLLGA